MTFELRPYQREAVAAIYSHLRERTDNPCVVIPTGGGKTPIMASVCKDAVGRWSGRVLILAHVKELLEQAVDKLHVVAPELTDRVGVYSAGLGRRDTDHPILIASIQSVYKRACDLGAFNLVLIDEAHMIPTEGDGRYRSFLEDARVINPKVRVIGFTATPFRLKSGLICGPENVLNHVCYEIGVRDLIDQKYLSPLVTKGSCEELDTSALHMRAGEFVASEAEDLMDRSERVELACREIVERSISRNSVLVFATSIRHAEHIASVLRETTGSDVGMVSGDTPPAERDEILSSFKARTQKYLVNVNVLTTGFDAPNIDCVALVRPTASPGLYYQMVGRGFRVDEDKENCLVLDFGGNVVRHGPVDAIRTADVMDRGDGEAPAKQCPECQSLIAAGYLTCPDCGFAFPPPNRQQHEAKASEEGVLSGQETLSVLPVRGVFYHVHHKRGASEDAPKTLRVEYEVGFHRYQSEWVCFEHLGFARQKAEDWWSQRSHAPVPKTVEEAQVMASAGVLCATTSITVRTVTGEPFGSISHHELGPKPVRDEPDRADEGALAHAGEPSAAFFGDDDDLPF